VPEGDWPAHEAQRGVILADFDLDGEYGDRRQVRTEKQELVRRGQDPVADFELVLVDWFRGRLGCRSAGTCFCLLIGWANVRAELGFRAVLPLFACRRLCSSAPPWSGRRLRSSLTRRC